MIFSSFCPTKLLVFVSILKETLSKVGFTKHVFAKSIAIYLTKNKEDPISV